MIVGVGESWMEPRGANIAQVTFQIYADYIMFKYRYP